MRAVPSEEPRFWPLYCGADLAAALGRRRGDDHVAELGATAIPEPRRGTAEWWSSSAPSSRRRRAGARPRAEQPAALHDAPRRRPRQELGHRRGGHHERERQRQQPHPRVEGVEAQAQGQEQRHREEGARHHQVLHDQDRQAAGQLAVGEQGRVNQRRFAPLDPAPSQATKASSRSRPPATSQVTAESEQRRCGVGPLGHPRLHPRPSSRLQHPEHRQPEPCRREQRAHDVEAGPLLAGDVADDPRGEQDAQRDHDLAGEHPAPAVVGGHEAADDRPETHGHRGGGRDRAVGARACASREAPRDEGDDRWHDETSPQALGPASRAAARRRWAPGRSGPSRTRRPPGRSEARAAGPGCRRACRR